MVASPTKTASSAGSPRMMPDLDAPSLELSETQAANYRLLAQEIVARTLEQEMRFRYNDSETLDERDWKFVRAKERMRVYKRAASTASVAGSDALLPMVLGVGCMEGTLEDALYGLHYKTTSEMRVVTSFLNKHHIDAAVLATIASGTDADPFEYLGLKWRVVQTPGPGVLVKNRDVLTLEHMGTSVDANGHKYGFHLIKSVDHPDAPELAGNAQAAAAPDAVRAQIMTCFIYRQLTPTRVGAYCKAIFDLGGELLDFLSVHTAAEMVLGISKALECAAAKRLTLLALTQDMDALMLRSSTRQSKDALDLTSLSLSSDSDSAPASETTTTAPPPPVPSTREHPSAKTACVVCCKKRFFSLGPSTRVCKICARAACSKCYVKTTVFATPRNLTIVCCKACVIESRALQVDPRDALPVLMLESEVI